MQPSPLSWFFGALEHRPPGQPHKLLRVRATSRSTDTWSFSSRSASCPTSVYTSRPQATRANQRPSVAPVGFGRAGQRSPEQKAAPHSPRDSSTVPVSQLPRNARSMSQLLAELLGKMTRSFPANLSWMRCTTMSKCFGWWTKSRSAVPMVSTGHRSNVAIHSS